MRFQQHDPNDILSAARNDVKVPSPSSAKSRDPVTLQNMVDNVYQKYILQDRDDDFYNEHEFFLGAKADMQKHHHDRVTNVSAHSIVHAHFD